ncbi:hypothetical protein [Neorhizobium sp. JUb45]|uniref:hypothetical protein n=1 Tax=unclassified Neorhizobium TaxID=2629175 RepID=UPI0010CE2593|nr:hypothetical protein [Neorhizobium sp. JUb45]TCR07122.1 hypothetical protein EDF70_1011089 [Neorhizobium sp. JUb45]
MAMFTSHHAHKSNSVFGAVWAIAVGSIAEVRASWRRRKNAELIQSMPAELRKDIGWPTSDILNEKNGDIRH